MHVGLQDRLLFLALVDILLAHPYDRPQRLDVEARALGLRIDVADIVGDRLLFLLQPLDALDEGLELILAESDGRLVVLGGGSSSGGRHRSLLPFTQHRVPARRIGSRASWSSARPRHPHGWAATPQVAL